MTSTIEPRTRLADIVNEHPTSHASSNDARTGTAGPGPSALP